MKALNNENVSILALSPKKEIPPNNQIPQWFKPYGQIIENMQQFIIDQSKINRLIIARLDKVDQRLDKVEQRLDKVEQRLDKVDQRLDNLVKKNNLKE